MIINITEFTSGLVDTPGVTITSGVSNGTVVASTIDNTVTYTPTPGYYGTDSFNYTITGPGGTSNVGSVTLVVPFPATLSTASKSNIVASVNHTPSINLHETSGALSILTFGKTSYNSSDTAQSVIISNLATDLTDNPGGTIYGNTITFPNGNSKTYYIRGIS